MAAQFLANHLMLHDMVRPETTSGKKTKKLVLGNSKAGQSSPTLHEWFNTTEADEKQKSLGFSRLEKGDYIVALVAHLQHPIMGETVRIVVRAYLKYHPTAKDDFTVQKPLSRNILAIAAVKVSNNAL